MHALLVILSLLIFTAQVNSQFPSRYVQYFLNIPNGDFSSCDIDGDNIADVVLGSLANPTRIYWGSSMGPFGLPYLSIPEQGPATCRDVNGDRYADVIIMDVNGTATIYTGYSRGLTFYNSTRLTTGAASQPLLIDYNKDNITDIVLSGPSRIQFHSGMNVSGVFRFNVTADFTYVNGRTLLTSGDTNGDGLPDVLCAHASADYPIVFTNRGGGNFQVQTYTSITTSRVATGLDINNDGYDDYLLGVGPRYLIAYGSSSGTVSPNIYSGIYTTPVYTFALPDCNADGFDDYLICEFSQELVQLYTGNTTGLGTLVFQYQNLTGAGLGFYMTYGDYDGQGSIDFILGSANSVNNPTVVVYNVFGPVIPSVTPTPSTTPSVTPSRTPSPSTSPSRTPSSSSTPSITPTPSVSPSRSPSSSATPSVSPTPSPSSTPSVTPSSSSTPSITPTPSVTRTPSATPSVTPSPSSTPSVTPSPSSSPSLNSSPSSTPSISPSHSITPTRTPSVTPSPSSTPSITPTPSVTPSQTPSPSSSPSISVSPSPSSTPSITSSPSVTPSSSVSPSSTPSISSTPAASPSRTPSISASSSPSRSPSGSPSRTPSITPSRTPSRSPSAISPSPVFNSTSRWYVSVDCYGDLPRYELRTRYGRYEKYQVFFQQLHELKDGRVNGVSQVSLPRLNWDWTQPILRNNEWTFTLKGSAGRRNHIQFESIEFNHTIRATPDYLDIKFDVEIKDYDWETSSRSNRAIRLVYTLSDLVRHRNDDAVVLNGTRGYLGNLYVGIGPNQITADIWEKGKNYKVNVSVTTQENKVRMVYSGFPQTTHFDRLFHDPVIGVYSPLTQEDQADYLMYQNESMVLVLPPPSSGSLSTSYQKYAIYGGIAAGALAFVALAVVAYVMRVRRRPRTQVDLPSTEDY